MDGEILERGELRAQCDGRLWWGLKAPWLSDFSLRQMLPLPGDETEGKLLTLSVSQFSHL